MRTVLNLALFILLDNLSFNFYTLNYNYFQLILVKELNCPILDGAIAPIIRGDFVKHPVRVQNFPF